MGQHMLPIGSKLRYFVFWNQILFIELQYIFQFAVADDGLFFFRDILPAFALTILIRYFVLLIMR